MENRTLTNGDILENESYIVSILEKSRVVRIDSDTLGFFGLCCKYDKEKKTIERCNGFTFANNEIKLKA